MFSSICSAVNSVNIRDSTIKTRISSPAFLPSPSYPPQQNRAFVCACSCHFATRGNANLEKYRWRNHTLYKICTLGYLSILIDNRSLALLWQWTTLAVPVNFAKLLLFPISPAATSLEIALFPKAARALPRPLTQFLSTE